MEDKKKGGREGETEERKEEKWKKKGKLTKIHQVLTHFWYSDRLLHIITEFSQKKPRMIFKEVT